MSETRLVPAELSQTRHHFADVTGRQVFYREAGDPAAPALVLHHGAPVELGRQQQFRHRNPALPDDD